MNYHKANSQNFWTEAYILYIVLSSGGEIQLIVFRKDAPFLMELKGNEEIYKVLVLNRKLNFE